MTKNLSDLQKSELEALVRETEAARVRAVRRAEKIFLEQEGRVKESVSDVEYAKRLERSIAKDNVVVGNVKAERIERSLQDWKSRVGPTFSGATTDNPLVLDRIARLQSKRGVYKTSLVLHGSMGVGKAQPLSEVVLTSDGFKRMGDVRVGDFVVGSSGCPVEVVGVFPQGVRDVVKVSFSDGSSVLVDLDHLWSVYNVNGAVGVDGDLQVLPTSDIVSGGVLTDSGEPKFGVPLVEPVQFSAKDVTVAPYLCGFLLNNGLFLDDTVVVSTKEDKMLFRLVESLPAGVVLGDTVAVSDGYSFNHFVAENSTNVGVNVLDGMRQLLTMLPAEKKIPEQYLFGDVNQRVQLLAGLFDSSSAVVDNGDGLIIFSTISEQLTEGITHLVQSLGGTAHVVSPENVGRSSVVVRDTFTVNVRLTQKVWEAVTGGVVSDDVLFVEPVRHIVSVDAVGREETQCISVDAVDSLYVTAQFIVTHNTWNCYAYINMAIAAGVATAGQIICDTETGVLGKITVSGYKKPELLEQLMHPRNKIFFIDDVGQGFFSDSQKRTEVWFELLDHIYTHQLTLLLTTNLNGTQLNNWIGPRAFDRLKAIVGDGYIEPSKVNKRDSVLEEQERQYKQR